MNCPRCGAKVSEAANFCTKCGTKLKAVQDKIQQNKIMQVINLALWLISIIIALRVVYVMTIN